MGTPKVYFYFYYNSTEEAKKYLIYFEHSNKVHGIVCSENGANPIKLSCSDYVLNHLLSKGNTELKNLPEQLEDKIQIFLDYIYSTGSKHLFNTHFREIFKALHKIGANYFIV